MLLLRGPSFRLFRTPPNIEIDPAAARILASALAETATWLVHQHQQRLVSRRGITEEDSDMPFYRTQGNIPSKHFTVLRRPDGERYYEEIMSSTGFNGPAALLYRLHNSTRVARVEKLPAPALKRWDDGTIRNHRIDVEQIKGSGEEFETRTTLFFNEDLIYSVSKPTETGNRFYRNGFRDELLLFSEGSGVFESIFGEIAYGPLDFLYVPRGTTWRLRPDAKEHTIIVLETRTAVGPPERYRNASGQFLARSLYSERDIRGPVLGDPVDQAGAFEVAVRADDRLSLYTLDVHPFDVVGWDGALYPYALNLMDLEPLNLSRDVFTGCQERRNCNQRAQRLGHPIAKL